MAPDLALQGVRAPPPNHPERRELQRVLAPDALEDAEPRLPDYSDDG